MILIEANAFGDERGFFMEMYKRSEFSKYGITQIFVQDNHSHSVRGVLRGLHYQKQPAAQAKLISVIRGEVFDVAVDIRKGSPTYGRWVSEILSQRNHRMLYVPEGFAHGFLVLSEVADVVYKGYSVSHGVTIYLLNPDGDLQAVFRPTVDKDGTQYFTVDQIYGDYRKIRDYVG